MVKQVSDGYPVGFCYLSIVKEESLLLAIAQIGPYPHLNRLKYFLSTRPDWFTTAYANVVYPNEKLMHITGPGKIHLPSLFGDVVVGGLEADAVLTLQQKMKVAKSKYLTPDDFHAFAEDCPIDFFVSYDEGICTIAPFEFSPWLMAAKDIRAVCKSEKDHVVLFEPMINPVSWRAFANGLGPGSKVRMSDFLGYAQGEKNFFLLVSEKEKVICQGTTSTFTHILTREDLHEKYLEFDYIPQTEAQYRNNVMAAFMIGHDEDPYALWVLREVEFICYGPLNEVLGKYMGIFEKLQDVKAPGDYLETQHFVRTRIWGDFSHVSNADTEDFRGESEHEDYQDEPSIDDFFGSKRPRGEEETTCFKEKGKEDEDCLPLAVAMNIPVNKLVIDVSKSIGYEPSLDEILSEALYVPHVKTAPLQSIELFPKTDCPEPSTDDLFAMVCKNIQKPQEKGKGTLSSNLKPLEADVSKLCDDYFGTHDFPSKMYPNLGETSQEPSATTSEASPKKVETTDAATGTLIDVGSSETNTQRQTFSEFLSESKAIPLTLNPSAPPFENVNKVLSEPNFVQSMAEAENTYQRKIAKVINAETDILVLTGNAQKKSYTDVRVSKTKLLQCPGALEAIESKQWEQAANTLAEYWNSTKDNSCRAIQAYALLKLGHYKDSILILKDLVEVHKLGRYAGVINMDNVLFLMIRALHAVGKKEEMNHFWKELSAYDGSPFKEEAGKFLKNIKFKV